MIKSGTKVYTKEAKDKLPERVFIGTLGIDCLDYTKRCIDTVIANVESLKFCYMDNGSTEDSLSVINSWKNDNPYIDEFEVVINGHNAGVAVGWNLLIDRALEWGATKILICNNDIAFGKYTIDGLCEAYNRLEKENPNTVMVTAANRTKNAGELKRIKQEWKYNEHPDFSCYMITPKTIEVVGKFNEIYKPGYFEDNDYHWRILLLGYKAYSTDWAPYSHIASRTRYAHPNLVTHHQFRANKCKFFQTMITDTVDQEVAVARYNKWAEITGEEHAYKASDVLNLLLEKGHIDSKFNSEIQALTPDDFINKYH